MSGKLFDDAPIGMAGSLTYYPLTGATSVSGPDSSGLILSCTPSPQTVWVWLNGQKVPYGDLAVTQSSITITGYTFTAGDVLEVIAMTVVALANIFFATQAEMKAAAATDRIVTPGLQKQHPLHAKVAMSINGATGALLSGAGGTPARTATGTYSITFGTSFSSANYAAIITPQSSSVVIIAQSLVKSAGVMSFQCVQVSGFALYDPTSIDVVIFGDQ